MTGNEKSDITVVLVHGAFADAGSFAGVTALLLQAGVSVLAPSNPLRGLHSDSAYIASVFAQIDGPVLAVGHSYGGAVITNAATNAPNVKGLVYVAAFAPEENETLTAAEGTSHDSVLGASLVPKTYPTGVGDETAVELYVKESDFHTVFAADLSAADSALYGASQRPVAAAAFDEATGVPAWKTLPAWSVVATGDKAAGADVILSMAQRAGATITELEGSHVIMISRPADVTAVIMTALEAVSQQ
jgi:pimeloyl-ACP methyl ester carboxylesterase